MQELLLPVMFVLLWLLLKFLRNEAVFVPLPMGTVRKMLKLAKIKKSDILYDLGSGDGRIVVEAARKYGIRSFGVEKSRLLCWLAKKKSGNLKGMVKIVNGDLFDTDLSDATVVTLYLSRKTNSMLRPKLMRELRKGTRIISADHTLGGMKEVNRVRAGHLYLHVYER